MKNFFKNVNNKEFIQNFLTVVSLSTSIYFYKMQLFFKEQLLKSEAKNQKLVDDFLKAIELLKAQENEKISSLPQVNDEVLHNFALNGWELALIVSGTILFACAIYTFFNKGDFPFSGNTCQKPDIVQQTSDLINESTNKILEQTNSILAQNTDKLVNESMRAGRLIDGYARMADNNLARQLVRQDHIIEVNTNKVLNNSSSYFEKLSDKMDHIMKLGREIISFQEEHIAQVQQLVSNQSSSVGEAIVSNPEVVQSIVEVADKVA